MHGYVWMILLLAVAALFNLVRPVLFSNYIFGTVSTFALFLFFICLELLKPEPELALIAGPRGESL